MSKVDFNKSTLLIVNFADVYGRELSYNLHRKKGAYILDIMIYNDGENMIGPYCIFLTVMPKIATKNIIINNDVTYRQMK